MLVRRDKRSRKIAKLFGKQISCSSGNYPAILHFQQPAMYNNCWLKRTRCSDLSCTRFNERQLSIKYLPMDEIPCRIKRDVCRSNGIGNTRRFFFVWPISLFVRSGQVILPLHDRSLVDDALTARNRKFLPKFVNTGKIVKLES